MWASSAEVNQKKRTLQEWRIPIFLCAWIAFALTCTRRLSVTGFERSKTSKTSRCCLLIHHSPDCAYKSIMHSSHVPTCVAADGLHLVRKPYVWISLPGSHGHRRERSAVWISLFICCGMNPFEACEETCSLLQKAALEKDISPSLSHCHDQREIMTSATCVRAAFCRSMYNPTLHCTKGPLVVAVTHAFIQPLIDGWLLNHS